MTRRRQNVFLPMLFAWTLNSLITMSKFCRHIFSLSTRMASSTAGSSAKKLSGKVAIVTASTEGIGFAIARRLGEDGAKVMVSSRKQKNVEEAVRTLKGENIDVEGVVCHVGNQTDRDNLVSQTVERFGGIDIFVSNAAVNPVFGPMLDCNEQAWDKIFDINVKAAFLLTKDIVPHMVKRGGGAIVYNSSVGGFSPFQFLGPYSVSKTALLGLTKALVHQLSDSNIRVNLIAPGIIQTKFSEQLHKSDAVAEVALQSIPLKRFGKPSECAGLVSFLVSDDASYITGENFVISGGMQTRL